MKNKAVSCDYLHMTSTPVSGTARSRVSMNPAENSLNFSKIYVSCCSMLKCSSGDSFQEEWEIGTDKSPNCSIHQQTTPMKSKVAVNGMVRMRSVEQIEKCVVDTLRREEADEVKRNEELMQRLCGSIQNIAEVKDCGSQDVKVTRWNKVKTNLKSIRRLLKKDTSSTRRSQRCESPVISEPFPIPAGSETPTKLKLLPLKVNSSSVHDVTDLGMDSGCFVSPDVEFPRTVYKEGKQCTFC